MPGRPLRAWARETWHRYLRGPLCRFWGELPDTGERVDPRRPTPLLEAHRALYRFAAGFASPGAKVLDLGCGAGYGAPLLVAGGAAEVVGVDLDRAAVAFARRHYASEAVRFLRLDLATAIRGEARETRRRFDLVVASNCFEHVPGSLDLVARASPRVTAEGRLVLAVPPCDGTGDGNPWHCSEFPAAVWAEALGRGFTRVQGFAHHGWGSPEARHEFPEAAPEALVPGRTVTAILVASGPRE